MTKTEAVKRMIRLQKEFAKLYDSEEAGLVTVWNDNVHITEHAFSEICKGREVWREPFNEQYKYEYRMYIDGVKFTCISNREDIQNEK